MFGIGDTILYGTQGACRIDAIEEKKICGKVSSYYVLTPLDGTRCTIYAPIDSKTIEGKMHRLLSAAEIEAIIESMKNEEVVWIESESARKERYKQILAGNDRVEIMKMIRALYLHKQELKSRGKKLHVSDERFFKDAEKVLYNEFAVVLDIKPNEVISFITDKLGKE